MGDVGDQRLAIAEERTQNASRNTLLTVIPARAPLSALERATRSKLRGSPVVSHVCRAKITETIRILHRHLRALVHHQATVKRNRISRMTEMK